MKGSPETGTSEPETDSLFANSSYQLPVAGKEGHEK
jgi:hypothetical protein